MRGEVPVFTPNSAPPRPLRAEAVRRLEAGRDIAHRQSRAAGSATMPDMTQACSQACETRRVTTPRSHELRKAERRQMGTFSEITSRPRWVTAVYDCRPARLVELACHASTNCGRQHDDANYDTLQAARELGAGYAHRMARLIYAKAVSDSRLVRRGEPRRRAVTSCGRRKEDRQGETSQAYGTKKVWSRLPVGFSSVTSQGYL